MTVKLLGLFVCFVLFVVEQRTHTSMHLFRKDLRLHDNPTLRACLEGSGTFYPVYVLDTAAARQALSKVLGTRFMIPTGSLEVFCSCSVLFLFVCSLFCLFVFLLKIVTDHCKT